MRRCLCGFDSLTYQGTKHLLEAQQAIDEPLLDLFQCLRRVLDASFAVYSNPTGTLSFQGFPIQRFY